MFVLDNVPRRLGPESHSDRDLFGNGTKVNCTLTPALPRRYLKPVQRITCIIARRHPLSRSRASKVGQYGDVRKPRPKPTLNIVWCIEQLVTVPCGYIRVGRGTPRPSHCQEHYFHASRHMFSWLKFRDIQLSATKLESRKHYDRRHIVKLYLLRLGGSVEPA